MSGIGDNLEREADSLLIEFECCMKRVKEGKKKHVNISNRRRKERKNKRSK